MSKNMLSVEGAVTPAEALHFAAVTAEILRRPAMSSSAHLHAAEYSHAPHIGTLREKRLHAAVKQYLCPDTACHERLVGEEPGMTDEKKKCRMVADILVGRNILEVQTGGFYPLREKVARYLAHTDCHVTVVHPMAAVKYLSWMDPESGEILSRHRSPKRGRVKDVARELYWLSDFIGNERFSLRLLLLELEEYRMADGWSQDGKRGSNRYERFPTALLGDVTLASAEDYATYFLPAAWRMPNSAGAPVSFTAAEYAAATGIRGRATYGILHLLERLALIREGEEKQGRSRTYVLLPKR